MTTSVSHSPGPTMPNIACIEGRTEPGVVYLSSSDAYQETCRYSTNAIKPEIGGSDYDCNFFAACTNELANSHYDYEQSAYDQHQDDTVFMPSPGLLMNQRAHNDEFHDYTRNNAMCPPNFITQRSGSFGGQSARYSLGLGQGVPLREAYSNNPILSNVTDTATPSNDCAAFNNWRAGVGPSPFLTSTPIKQGDLSQKNDYLSPQKPMSMDLFYRIAQERGYIVGLPLERVLQRSSRSNATINNKILSQFKNRYGEVDSKTRSAYMQLGVRVPSKDHVSEIVGKGGSKIKTLRDETGALITTPGEHEDHVFIIEAPPQVALKVAEHLSQRSEEITLNKTTDRRRNSGTNSGLSGHRKVLIKDKISVPQDLVGKIIGTQGSIITTIQRDTGTEIRSPPKDLTRDPKGTADFEIATYDNSQMSIDEAKRRIYIAKQFIAHLVIRQFEKAEEEENGHTQEGLHSSGVIDLNENWPLVSSNARNRGSQASNDPSPISSISNHFNIMTHWKWTDIQPMPLDEARAVIDRILNESKNKTRKESPESPEAPPFPSGIRSTATPNVISMSQYRGEISLNGSGGVSSSNNAYYSSPLNESMPTLFNSAIANHIEPRSLFNTTIGTTDGSDLARDYPRCESGNQSNNGTGNATPFNQWTSYHSNVRFGGSQSAFDPPQSIGNSAGNISFGRSIPESLETLTCGARTSLLSNGDQTFNAGAGGYCANNSVGFPNGDSKLSALDTLSQQFNAGLSFHSQRRGTYPTPTINEDPFAPTFPNYHHHSFAEGGAGLNQRNFSTDVTNGPFLPPSFKRFHETFTYSNDSGFESLSNGGGGGSAGSGSAGSTACFRSTTTDTCSVITSLSSNPNNNGPPSTGCTAPMTNFLDQHSLMLDKNNPWRTNSFSNIDNLHEFPSHDDDLATPVPQPQPPQQQYPAKVGIIGDGRKKTPSPPLQNADPMLTANKF